VTIYLLIEEQAQGPFALDQVRSMIDQKRVTFDTLYAEHDAKDWKPLRHIWTQLLPAEADTTDTVQHRAISPVVRAALAIAVLGFIATLLFIAGTDLISQPGIMITVLALSPLAFVIYFVPALVAQSRTHKNSPAILLLNIFLGWTFIGWTVALVWAAKKD
jgi:hypothetical protein